MKHLNIKLLAAIIFSLILLPTHSKADVIPSTETVYGTVVDKNNNPLPGAKVEIIGQSVSAYTDLDGHFNIKCKSGAKNILVSYPKAPDVKTRIRPDMTIRIGRTWRDAPEQYQWFVGANCGIGVTYLFVNNIPHANNNKLFDAHGSVTGVTISLMGGRVKDVGWYAKVFRTPQMSYSYGAYTYNEGGILGGMVRMGCPLHFCLGFGVGKTQLKDIPSFKYEKLNWQIDFGFLYRIKDHFGINLSFNAGLPKNLNYVAVSYANLGVSYFFNR